MGKKHFITFFFLSGTQALVELLVKKCAYNKAMDVSKRISGEYLVVSADTVVVNDNMILGKPKDKSEAIMMLKSLSNKTHFVATSVCLLSSSGKKIINTDITYVSFRKLTENEIIKYIETKNPLDKAGSYGIQDEDFDFCTKLNGELDNVIGFPLMLFKKMLEDV